MFQLCVNDTHHPSHKSITFNCCIPLCHLTNNYHNNSSVPTQLFQYTALLYQIVSHKYWLILTDLHGVVSQNIGIYISIAVATPNLG